MEDVRWPAEQLEEHRLEISNRIRNLFWTVSGDFDMEFEPDTEKYVYSKQTVLYEAVKQGAFARYFDQKKLGMYLMKKLHYFFSERYLLPFPSGYIVEIIFSKILRTVAKVATAGLYDMIWNLSKNLNFF